MFLHLLIVSIQFPIQFSKAKAGFKANYVSKRVPVGPGVLLFFSAEHE